MRYKIEEKASGITGSGRKFYRFTMDANNRTSIIEVCKDDFDQFEAGDVLEILISKIQPDPVEAVA